MTRFTPGLSSAPANFQRLSESLLVGLEGVIVFMDDVLIMGENEAQLKEHVHTGIRRLLEAGLHLRLDKCVFSVASLDYVGYSLSAEGIKPSKSKVQELLDTPSPSCLEELQAFLGYVNFYGCYAAMVAMVTICSVQVVAVETFGIGFQIGSE